jgi:invasion protein IalB
MVMLVTLRAALIVAAVLGALGPSMAQEAPALPGGASSLQETYQDWLVACVVADAGKRCAMSQQQSQQNGQRVLAIELVPGPEGRVNGALVLPFGVALEAGATLQIDDQAPWAPGRFSTCLPVGCILPVSFDDASVQSLRRGNALNVNLSLIGSSEPVTLSISLKGFSVALDRTTSLSE